MKIQDIGFIFALVMLLVIKKPRILLIAGLVSWVIAIPLFAKWIFFTAERFTWYGAAFVFVFLLISFVKPNTVK